MSFCNILACGETGKYWDGTGPSIGVNDCWKYKPTDYLIVVDSPGRFERSRLDIIRNSKPKYLLTDNKAMLRLFHNPDEVERLKPNRSYKQLFCTDGKNLTFYRFSKWTGTLYKDRLQYSHTSPFIALSLAYVLGFREITLWGVDFKTHKTWKETNPHMTEELSIYKHLIRALEAEGLSITIGHHDSLLNNICLCNKI